MELIKYTCVILILLFSCKKITVFTRSVTDLGDIFFTDVDEKAKCYDLCTFV